MFPVVNITTIRRPRVQHVPKQCECMCVCVCPTLKRFSGNGFSISRLFDSVAALRMPIKFPMCVFALFLQIKRNVRKVPLLDSIFPLVNNSLFGLCFRPSLQTQSSGCVFDKSPGILTESLSKRLVQYEIYFDKDRAVTVQDGHCKRPKERLSPLESIRPTSHQPEASSVKSLHPEQPKSIYPRMIIYGHATIRRKPNLNGRENGKSIYRNERAYERVAKRVWQRVQQRDQQRVWQRVWQRGGNTLQLRILRKILSIRAQSSRRVWPANGVIESTRNDSRIRKLKRERKFLASAFDKNPAPFSVSLFLSDRTRYTSTFDE